jgi:energy-converting hydrogenase Eha subunit F
MAHLPEIFHWLRLPEGIQRIAGYKLAMVLLEGLATAEYLYADHPCRR